MASVLDYIECPNCKLEAMDDTSYHGTVINSTINELTRMIGKPQFDMREPTHQYDDSYGDIWDGEKVTVEWTCETKDGDVFTIYDWKEYRYFNEDDIITFHIGGHSEEVTKQAFEELMKL